MTDKLFNVCGVSTLNGETKVRFANDVMRIKVLAKNGHTDIQLVELPEAMSKADAAQFISQLDEFQSAEAQMAVSEYLDKNTKAPAKAKAKATKAVAAVKLPKAKKAKDPAVKAPKTTVADLSDVEDAPF